MGDVAMAAEQTASSLPVSLSFLLVFGGIFRF